jgi:hypothetical protein
VSVAKDIDTMTKPKIMSSVQEKAPRIFKPLEESLKEEYIASTSKARCPSCKSALASMSSTILLVTISLE